MLYELALQFRFLQLYAHNAHNLVSGEAFFADHEFLGGLYPAYEAAYDATVERMIGLRMPLNLARLQAQAGEMVGKATGNAWFGSLLHGESVIQDIVEKCFEEDDYTQGTLNLLAQFADDSEVRTYKIQQRLR